MATNPQPNPLLQLTPSQVNRSETAQWLAALKQHSADMRCASPAFLVADMDAATQTVTVQIAIQEQVRIATGPVWMDTPQIAMVPIMTPRGGGFADTFPLKKGDEGMLIFCDACIDFWWANGQTSSPPPTYPKGAPSSGSQIQNEVRRHYIHDCGFYPGLWSQKRLLANYSTTSRQIRTDDGTTAVIDVSETGVAITAAAVTAANGGTPKALVNDVFYQWFVTNVEPFLIAQGYSGPGVPVGGETSVFKAQ